jgi:hypothetical protein
VLFIGPLKAASTGPAPTAEEGEYFFDPGHTGFAKNLPIQELWDIAY